MKWCVNKVSVFPPLSILLLKICSSPLLGFASLFLRYGLLVNSFAECARNSSCPESISVGSETREA